MRALLHKVNRWSSKVNLLCICIPNKSTEFFSLFYCHQFQLCAHLSSETFVKSLTRIFQGYVILFRLNQWIAFSESFPKVVSSASFSLEIEEIVLSSAKLCISEFSSVVSRSFKNKWPQNNKWQKLAYFTNWTKSGRNFCWTLKT